MNTAKEGTTKQIDKRHPLRADKDTVFMGQLDNTSKNDERSLCSKAAKIHRYFKSHIDEIYRPMLRSDCKIQFNGPQSSESKEGKLVEVPDTVTTV